MFSLTNENLLLRLIMNALYANRILFIIIGFLCDTKNDLSFCFSFCSYMKTHDLNSFGGGLCFINFAVFYVCHYARNIIDTAFIICSISGALTAVSCGTLTLSGLQEHKSECIPL